MFLKYITIVLICFHEMSCVPLGPKISGLLLSSAVYLYIIWATISGLCLYNLQFISPLYTPIFSRCFLSHLCLLSILITCFICYLTNFFRSNESFLDGPCTKLIYPQFRCFYICVLFINSILSEI